MNTISISDLYQKFKLCSEVSTDTRKIGKNALFFALKGPNFNANTFSEKALEAGAKYVVVDEPEYVKNESIFLVSDSLLALQQLANFHRKQFNIPFIGLTGSNGKTTTKELIYNILSRKYRTHATQGNLNNHIGVPLTLLALPLDSEMAIIEMGANKQGDIKELVEICEPTHGLITNIGKAHLEGFGGVEGVKKGKGELFDWLAKNGETVFVNSENSVIVDMANDRFFHEKITYQLPNFYSNITLKEEIPTVSYISENSQLVVTHLTGKYNFENMANAFVIGKYFKVPETEINIGISCYEPTNNRSQFIDKGTNKVLMDAYNANPSSMKAAIENFNNLIATHKVVILGDMFELGDEAADEHKFLGEIIKNCNFEKVLLAGTHMQKALIHLPKALYFPDKFGLHNWLQDNPLTHKTILIKGSRGMSLESCLEFLN